MAKWTTAYKDRLPDTAFAAWRTLRQRSLPVFNHLGRISIHHVDNALARVNQVIDGSTGKRLSSAKQSKIRKYLQGLQRKYYKQQGQPCPPSSSGCAVPRRNPQRKLHRGDYRPRTKPGFYRRKGGDIIYVDDVFTASDLWSDIEDPDTLTPRDWHLSYISTLGFPDKDGPSANASSASGEMPVYDLGAAGYKRIKESDLKPKWKAFFKKAGVGKKRNPARDYSRYHVMVDDGRDASFSSQKEALKWIKEFVPVGTYVNLIGPNHYWKEWEVGKKKGNPSRKKPLRWDTAEWRVYKYRVLGARGAVYETTTRKEAKKMAGKNGQIIEYFKPK